MTNNKNYPIYRASFSRISEIDDAGRDVLARPIEIGAVWPRKGDKKGAILSFDIIPTDLINRNGVIFLTPVEAKERGYA